jgi:hypothetical protein
MRQYQREQSEHEMLEKLLMQARGMDPVTMQPIPPSEARHAATLYQQMKADADRRRLERDRMESERAIEAARLTAETEIEHRKLDIEQEKVQVQKAELVVRAIEAAAGNGLDPDRLLEAIGNFSNHLLPPPPTVKAIEQKD